MRKTLFLLLLLVVFVVSGCATSQEKGYENNDRYEKSSEYSGGCH